MQQIIEALRQLGSPQNPTLGIAPLIAERVNDLITRSER